MNYELLPASLGLWALWPLGDDLLSRGRHVDMENFSNLSVAARLESGGARAETQVSRFPVSCLFIFGICLLPLSSECNVFYYSTGQLKLLVANNRN